MEPGTHYSVIAAPRANSVLQSAQIDISDRQMTASKAHKMVLPPSGAIDANEIARTARELVDAYGPGASALMKKRTRAVRQRGDAESAILWSAVALAVEAQLAGTARFRAEAGDD
jgi:hypothetical protein